MKISLPKVGENEYSSIPDGRQNLKIEKVMFDEKTLKLSLLYKTEDGESDFENYNFAGPNKGEMNDKALRAFSYTVKCAKGEGYDEIDPMELTGCFIEANVSHEEYTKTDGTTGVSARFKEKKAGTPFGAALPVNDAEEDNDDSSWLPF